MRKILLLILIICATVYCQTPHTITIDDFSYGLSTVQKGYSPIPFASLAKNVDLTKYPYNMTVRDGYDSVFAMYGIDSFLWNGLHTINFRDGNKKLGLVGDSAGVGYANVYLTDKNTVELGVSDSIWLYPDTTSGDGLGYASPASAYSMIFYIQKNESQYKKVEADRSTAFTRAEIVDSLVAIINADAELSPRITASDLGDTLLIVEDSSDIETGFIFFVTDSSALSTPTGDFSRMRAVKSQSFQTSTGNRIYTKFPATGQLWWSQFKGVTYLGTGTGKAISYYGKTVNTFPMRAPGEPNIIPLTTSGNLNGRYRYAIKPAYVDSVADTLQRPTFSYLSQPIIVDSGQVMLWDFPLPTRDYYYEGADTVSYEIWRSVGDIGTLDRADSLFYTGITITFDDSGGFSDSIVVDTASDATIRGNSGQIYVDGDRYNWRAGSIDTLIHRYNQKVGSPAIVSWTNTSGGNKGLWGHSQIDGANDTVSWFDAAGYSYMCVFHDTVLNSPSDSSRSLNFYQGEGFYSREGTGILPTKANYRDSTFLVIGNDTSYLGFSRYNTEKMTIALPIANEGVRVKLYRGVIKVATLDSLLVSRSSTSHTESYRYLPAADSFICPFYYLIGTFNPGDTIVDSLCYDSLLAREVYERNAVPPIIKQMIVVDNQLLTHDGQNIFESHPTSDSVSFNVFSQNPINVDDGDEIVSMTAIQGIVKVRKNKSSYILKQNSAGYWRDIQISNNYGSVSLYADILAPEGNYFLSRDGVRLEDENIYRENSNIGSLMSNQLNNFTNMTAGQQKQCFGTYIDNKMLLSFPGLDTTYVLNKTPLVDGSYRYGWSTWDLTFCGADNYAVRADNYIYPGDTLYFIKSGSNGVYRFGTSTTDNGSDIQYAWASHQLTELFDGWKQITRLYIEAESSDTVDSSHFVGFYDERKLSISPLTKYLPRLDTSYAYMYEMPDAVNRKSWRVAIAKYPFVTGSGSTIFNRLLIEYTLNGEIPVR